MSVEAIAPALETEQTTQPAPEAGFSLPEEDTDLDAIWDKHNTTNGAERGADGKFTSNQTEEQPAAEEVEEGADTQSPVEGEGEDTADAAETSTPEATGVPLPSNWQGMDGVWEKIPDDVRHEIAERENRIHRTLSDQGRQLSTLKPVQEVIEQNTAQFANIRHPDGTPVQAQDAVAYLFQVNKDMTEKPVETIMNLAETFGVREQIAAQLQGQGNAAPGGNESVLLEKIAGLEQTIRGLQNPASIDQRITQHLEQDRKLRDGEALISRLTQDKPLYAEIPENVMVQFIQMARAEKGDTAEAADVFNTAYDMAVNAIPSLRAKLAAAKPAAGQDPRKVADAKRANGVNVTSTSSGKPRTLSEDEELAEVYDKSQRK